MKFYLASSSPRRRFLLKEIGFSFDVLNPCSPEVTKKGESAREMVLRLAEEKAYAALLLARRRSKSGILLSADTTVVSPKNRILNKPSSEKEARVMLRSLSGRRHIVLTAYVILAYDLQGLSIHRRVVRTAVRMRDLSPAEVRDYVASGEPLDKAGAYAAQGIGMCLIESIQGSYSNVVGLPMAEVCRDLTEKFGVRPRWKRG